MPMIYQKIQQVVLFITLTVLAGGCAAVVSNVTGDLAGGLTQAVMNQDDLKTVEQGAPAYMLLLDGLLHDDPDNVSLLLGASSLYGAYAGIFAREDTERAQNLSSKAMKYALHALCLENETSCNFEDLRYKELVDVVNQLNKSEIEAMYALGTAWFGWIQAHSGDWNAVADISKARKLMERVIELDSTYEGGKPYLYLGALATLIPPAMGGKPEEGKVYFEKAIELSNGKNLMAKTLYARHYARLMFDEELHNRLVNEVLDAEAAYPGLTLINTLAQKEAAWLKKNAEEYF